MEKKPVLYIIVPSYNEEQVLPLTNGLFREELATLQAAGKVDESSKIVFVNDGSKDKTWEIIEGLSQEFECIEGLSLSRNRGHQNALLAGLVELKDRYDICISIDCDGQDDVAAMEEMVDAYLNGSDVVYGVRSSRKTDSFFKRNSAQLYYRLLNSMGVESVYNHADYRLLSRRVVEELSRFEEVNLYLRGMVPLVGFNSTIVYYERHTRMAGESHYPLLKMLSLATNGIVSLSIKPIRLISALGFFLALAAFVGVVWVLVVTFSGLSVPGWASTVLPVCLMGGVQLLSVGIIGEYVGRIYMEVKRRPRWIIDRDTEGDGK